MKFQDRINQFKADGKNLFSSTVALLKPELYRALMPELYRDNPMAAYFALDVEQRGLVDEVHRIERQSNNIKTLISPI